MLCMTTMLPSWKQPFMLGSKSPGTISPQQCVVSGWRPLTAVESFLSPCQASMPTSASFVKLSPTDALLFSLPSSSRHKPSTHAGPSVQAALLKPAHTQGPRQLPGPSFAHTQPLLPDPLPYVTPASSMHSLAAHEHPVYGYTDPDFDYKSEIACIRTTALSGHNKGSSRVERGHHRKWLRFCSKRGLRTVRDDHEANSGRDRAGFQREVDILAAFLLQCHKEMPARGHRDQALPSSAANVVRGVRRIHQRYVPRVDMVEFAAVADVLKGMNQQYLETHGYRKMLRKRAEPWRKHHLHKICDLRKQVGVKVGKYTISVSLFWVSYFAIIETMASSGSRKSEMAVEGLWNKARHLSRGSIVWHINGQMVTSPTAAQLASLTEDDYVILCPPPSKTDAFGVIWGDKPIYLPVRFSAPYCAALRLRQLELIYPVPEACRLTTPLFCQEAGVPFTFTTLNYLLPKIKDIVMPEVDDNSVFTYHSFRVLLATQLGCAKRTGPEIQALCRWQSPASLAIYVRMQPRDAIEMLDAAQSATIAGYSTINLPPIKHADLSSALTQLT